MLSAGSNFRLCDWLPRGVFWKEIRQLRQMIWGLLSLEVVGYVLFFFLTDGPGASMSGGRGGAVGHYIPATLTLTAAWGSLGLLGALFFSLEKEENTADFLLRLPISRGRLLREKVLAGFAAWGILVLGSVLLFFLAQALWGPAAEALGVERGIPRLERPEFPKDNTAWTLSMCALAYGACMALSLRFSSTTISFLTGASLAAFIWIVIVVVGVQFGFLDWRRESISLIRGYGYIASAVVVVLALMARSARRSFFSLEENRATNAATSPPWSGRLPALSSRPPSLWSVELQQKWLLWGILLLLPFVSILIDLGITSIDPFLGAMPATFILISTMAVAAISGATFWTRREQVVTEHMLHHLPLRREAIVMRRLVSGLLFNATVVVLAIGLCHERILRGFTGLDILVGCYFAQVVFFLVGAVLSPLREDNLMCVFLTAIVGSLIVLPAVRLWAGDSTVDPVPIACSGAMVLGGLIATAYWSNVRSRALEPGLRKDLRRGLLAAAMVLGALLVGMVDPVGALRGIGIDL